MKKTLIIFTLSLFIFSCNNEKKNTTLTSVKTLEGESAHPGKKLMETNCYVCHSPTASQDDRVGPPMIAIKKHYIDSNTSKDEFIKSMQAWIKNPKEDDAKMFGAVKRFGLMPKQSFPDETIQQIADYMFDNEIEQPIWFEDHFKGKKEKGKGNNKGKGMHKQQAQSSFEKLPYGERGLTYALSTKAVLGKNLMGTIQKKGVIEALAFCNEQAYPLTDSMSVVHNANIKRVSDKPRNQNNQANSFEINKIETFKKQLKNKLEIEPIVAEIEEKVHVYYPIITNDMCLKCHGTPNQSVTNETLNKLQQLYPNDKALGYNINEIRGIWSVTFDK
ncbi:c-type heme family protein [Psychroserpens ponticola]|uniref:DUF3365 domain-containing protein n=1 Tax=Psychroserpens ponticola TaxID=2932268 RepID=A0ABY7S4N7_9FLAO|nr:DUF3365 domain-containing protein [Psychroserpens ponticola]WCO02865.1 DUF3365 domain-containing protein [Psychroserpens ponticola]